MKTVSNEVCGLLLSIKDTVSGTILQNLYNEVCFFFLCCVSFTVFKRCNRIKETEKIEDVTRVWMKLSRPTLFFPAVTSVVCVMNRQNAKCFIFPFI